MSSSIHLANAKGRDATVGMVAVKAAPAPKLGLPNEKMYFRRYLAATEKITHQALVKQFGEDYSQKLIESDPEVDIEAIGMQVEQTQTVYLDSAGDLMYVEPNFIDVFFNPDGSEKERRNPVDTVMNVNVEVPVRFSGRLVPIKDAVRKFGFRRKLQLRHVDGLTFDFLYEIAKELQPKVIEMFKLAAEEEMEWADYLFKDGYMLGLNSDILKKYMMFLTNSRLKAIGFDPIFEKTNNPINWINAWTNSESLQVAPQESEIESYNKAAVNNDLGDSDFGDFNF